MKKFFGFLVFILLSSLVVQMSHAATYNANGNWEYTPHSSWVDAGNVPGCTATPEVTTNIAITQSGDTFTIEGNPVTGTINGAIYSMVYSIPMEQGGTQTINSTITLSSCSQGVGTVTWEFSMGEYFCNGGFEYEIYRVGSCPDENVLPLASIQSPSTGTQFPAGQSITFSGSGTDSDGTISSYNWNFGDDTTASGNTATHSYSQSGTYTVTLTVTDDKGATATNSISIQIQQPVNSPPSATISTPTNNATFILNQSVSFQGSGTDSDGTIASYHWNFGDSGTASGNMTTHSYTQSGSYTVTLTVTDDKGATATNSISIQIQQPVNSPPSATISTPTNNATFILNQSVSFQGSGTDSDGTIASYHWNFGDGTSNSGNTITHTYTQAGTYSVRLTVTDDKGSSAIASITIQLQEPPNTPPSASIVTPSNNASFVMNQSISFQGSGTDSDGSIVSYSWTFGDGGTASGSTTTHTFTQVGTYTVKLTVTDNKGATATHSISIQIQEPPNTPPSATILTPTTNAKYIVNQSVSFQGSGTDSDGSIVSYSWTFGDGGTALGSTTTHTFTQIGTYTVKLTVTDNKSATATYSISIQIQEPPNTPPSATISSPTNNASFTLNQSISFQGSGTDSDGLIVSYSWTFGDGGIASGNTTTHSYTQPGNYTVILTLTDNKGATATSSIRIQIQQPNNILPSATISNPINNASFVLNESISFQGSGIDSDGSIASYSWTFGDGGTASGSTATHAYTQVGTYTVILSITDDKGAIATYSITIQLQEPPNTPPSAAITTPNNNASFVENQSISFQGSGTDSDGSIVSYHWNFGDSTNASENTTTHTYTQSGTYTVTLTVTDNKGATATASIIIQLQEPPNNAPSATITTPSNTASFVVNESISFQGSGTDTDGTIVLYNWDFGDATSNSGNTTTHTYAQSGTFTVTLTVTDDKGATATNSIHIQIHQPDNKLPLATIVYPSNTASCVVNESISFQGSGTDSDGSIASYHWNFGDDSQSTEQNPTHTYTTSGTYTVTLTVTDNKGSTGKATLSIQITAGNSAPTASIQSPLNQASYMVGESISFIGTGVDPEGGTLIYQWDFGDQNTSSLQQTEHTYNAFGTYTVRLKVIDTDGVFATQEITIIIRAKAIVKIINPASESNYTEGDAITFTGNATDPANGQLNNITLAWTSNIDRQLGTGDTVTKSNLSIGRHTITLTATDTNGVSSTDTITITVQKRIFPPQVRITSPETSRTYISKIPIRCISSASDIDGLIVSYLWNFGDGQTSTEMQPQHTYERGGTYSVKVSVKDNDGGVAEDSITIWVNNSPSVSISSPTNNSSYVLGDIIRFQAQASDIEDGQLDDGAFSWSSSIDGSLGIGKELVSSELSIGFHTIQLKVSDRHGATSTAQMNLFVLKEVSQPTPFITYPLNQHHFSLGESILFNSVGTDRDGYIISFQWNFGDGTLSDKQDTTHSYTNAGTYTVTLRVMDNDSATNSVSIELVIDEKNNQSPQVTILQPTGGKHIFGKNIMFIGLAVDPEDGTLENEQALTWISDIDGILGHGTALIKDSLSEGRHRIQLDAVDSYKNVASAFVEIEVTLLPLTPTVVLTTQGIEGVLRWNIVQNADGYQVFYAPYPNAETIGNIDVQNILEVRGELWSGFAFYFAVKAYNEYGWSDYSNIVYVIIP
ncbi:MAG: PKD domain-containing protein [Desulfobacterales bacterium]|nr:PKD domain-containing protein [Desulfobacterales bacterium]